MLSAIEMLHDIALYKFNIHIHIIRNDKSVGKIQAVQPVQGECCMAC